MQGSFQDITTFERKPWQPQRGYFLTHISQDADWLMGGLDQEVARQDPPASVPWPETRQAVPMQTHLPSTLSIGLFFPAAWPTPWMKLQIEFPDLSQISNLGNSAATSRPSPCSQTVPDRPVLSSSNMLDPEFLTEYDISPILFCYGTREWV